jgi:hypothetical protein
MYTLFTVNEMSKKYRNYISIGLIHVTRHSHCDIKKRIVTKNLVQVTITEKLFSLSARMILLNVDEEKN